MRTFVAIAASVALAAATYGAAPSPAAAQGASPPAAQNSAQIGRAIAFDRGKGNCLACHTIKGGDVPSNVGPQLINMRAQFPDRKRLYAIIYDEMNNNPQTVMPIFGKNKILSPTEINHVIDFLYTL